MTFKILRLLAYLLLTSAFANARPDGLEETPAFTNVPELTAAFRLLYSQKFPEARAAFAEWRSQGSSAN